VISSSSRVAAVAAVAEAGIVREAVAADIVP
jgi:hypothetical protein